ncbi:MAG TPA: GNAT family N-acetyltransferase [Micromonosporaceae bacterium]
MDFPIRPFTPADAPAVADLLNAVECNAGANPAFDAAEILEWSAEWGDLDRDTRLVLGPDGAPIAFGVAQAPPPDGFRAEAFGAVAPRWRGRGIGRELIAWQLARIDTIYRSAAPGVDWIVSSSANVADADALRLFERVGMSVRRYFLEMDAVTADAPRHAPVDGFRVAVADPVDRRALYDAHMAAFADHFGYQRRRFEDWVRTSLDSTSFRADLSRIAYVGDDIASYVLSYDDVLPDKLYIGQVGTRSASRGLGLASSLLSEVLVAAGAAGKHSARLNVDASSLTGAVGVYERTGFAVSGRMVAYAKQVDPA